MLAMLLVCYRSFEGCLRWRRARDGVRGHNSCLIAVPPKRGFAARLTLTAYSEMKPRNVAHTTGRMISAKMTSEAMRYAGLSKVAASQICDRM